MRLGHSLAAGVAADQVTKANADEGRRLTLTHTP